MLPSAPQSRNIMRTRTSALWACLLALALHLPSLSAEARPGRGPRVRALQGLLIDLARVEISNVEREDPGVERAVQQQLDQARRQLLGAVDGSVPFVQALRFTQRSLRIINNYNTNSYYEDEEVLPRMQQQLDQLGQRVEQLLTVAAAWSAGGPPPGWQPPPGWGAPGVNTPPPPPPQPGWNNRPPPPPPPPPGWNNQPPPPPPGYGQQGGVIAPDRFAKLLNQVRGAAFQDAQLNLIRDALSGNTFFTCQQIVALMSAASFDSGKVEIGALLFPRAVDPQNFSDLTGALTFESYRQQLRQRVGR